MATTIGLPSLTITFQKAAPECYARWESQLPQGG